MPANECTRCTGDAAGGHPLSRVSKASRAWGGPRSAGRVPLRLHALEAVEEREEILRSLVDGGARLTAARESAIAFMPLAPLNSLAYCLHRVLGEPFGREGDACEGS